ncbi:hypothetical protein PENTCL1PPCAC_29218 [Pristionchus entomophagus]|uniref:Uncharacterized protein n=1 Tax=Pristionchus entomophagus TaxID=358040 RepID=A0AAV5UM92_9BILA|nr:hypothetical protein PENTCL1PPCAC_29218 [Pristionchus entomophagus]
MRTLVLLTTFFWSTTAACDLNDISSCVEKLPLQPNQTVNQNLLESLLTATSDAKLLEICIIYESAMPCFERKIDECGTKEDRSAVARTKRLYNFVCDKAGYADRLMLTRSASCITRALSAFIPSTCPISSTPYAQKMTSCKALCPAYSATCRDKILRSHRAICAVERVKNTCGDGASKLYTQLQQVMLANDFPIECDVLSASTTNAVDTALRHAAIHNHKHAISSRYRSSTLKPRWFKTSMVPFTIPTRTPPSIVIRGGRATTAKPRYTTSRRTPPPRLGRVTMIWNKLIATTKPPPTSLPITESPEEEIDETETTTEREEEENEERTSTAPTPEIKKIKKFIKVGGIVRRPKTTTTTTELTPSKLSEVTELVTTESPTTTVAPSSTTTTTARPMTTDEILKIAQPWRPFHWLSGARTIPDSILIDQFLNWRPDPTQKPAEFSGVTGLPPHKRIVIEKIPEKIDWKSIQAVVGRPTNSTDTYGFELTHQYIKNAVEKMKKSEVPAGQAVANTIDRLFSVVKSVVDAIPKDSASHLKRGFETLSRILLQAQH